jgi:hypothetical protein
LAILTDISSSESARCGVRFNKKPGARWQFSPFREDSHRAPLVPHHDERTRLEGLMSACRELARTDRCVLDLSAVGRSWNGKGQVNYGDHLIYANLRGSSELEFAPDDVAILVRANDQERSADTWTLTLKHEKCRHGPTIDKTLLFHRSVQTFIEACATTKDSRANLRDDLRRDFKDEEFQ